VASLFIAGVDHFVRVANISLVYLLVVLWLARRFGRGPALAASVLAFLTYDFFFIPPLYTITIDDPTEWFSLFALLATALVLGHATAAVQARAQEAIANERQAVISERLAIEREHEALDSQRRTESLYELGQLIVSTHDVAGLYGALAARIVSTFADAGVAACAIMLPDEHGLPVLRGGAPPESPLLRRFDTNDRQTAGCASWVLQHGTPVGLPAASRASKVGSAPVALLIPLRTDHRTVGALGIVGDEHLRVLVGIQPANTAAGRMDSEPSYGTSAAQVGLFGAFCAQMALALDRLAFQQEAIHVEILRESDRLKDLLLGSVTHDLRTPLAAIEAAAGSLLEPDITWSEAERQEFLESIMVSADRLNRLVSNLLDLSRLEAGVARPERKWYPIGDVVATVLDRLELARRLTSRRVELEIPEDLPLALLDHAQIEQVLTNLLENAIKYSPPKSTIRVQARVIDEVPGRPELEVRVADQGIGIPADELQLIFDRFYRVQHVQLPWAPARPPIGTGLGLAICAAIIEAHGGRIWAESQPHAGSTFVFTLPISPQPQSALPDLDRAHEDGASGVGSPADDAPAPIAPGASV
jgi:two-component system sensor histidine kinase KdpD